MWFLLIVSLLKYILFEVTIGYILNRKFYNLDLRTIVFNKNGTGL